MLNKKNASIILSCLGAVGVVATAIVTAKATIKAFDILEDAEKNHELTKKEKIKAVAPTYIPAVVLGASTVACIFGANVLSTKYQASLMSAYALVNSSYEDYKRKLKELYGEDAHEKIMDELAVEKANDVCVSAESILNYCDISVDGENAEKRLFYDELSKRYFEASIEQVLAAEYHLNRNFMLRGYVTINEFYEFLGISHIDGGDMLGWDVCEEIFWIDFDHRKITLDDGMECCYISTVFSPSEDWLKYQ